MAVTSMTGFARFEGVHGEIRFVWEIRSVNGKALDLRPRLPPGFDGMEPELRRLAASSFTRGNLAASLQLTLGLEAGALGVNRELLAELTAITDELVRAGHAAPPTADGLLALRGVIEARDPLGAGNDPSFRAAILSGFEAALADLGEVRAREGAAIAAVLTRRLDEIEALVEKAEKDPSRMPEAIAARLRGQVAALLETGTSLDAQRLAQEAALLATRADIREELDRLGAHLSAARELLVSPGAVGRRLDFLAQEFNRESNTICSKSNAASLTAVGLALKVAVDQFREQVQNIE